ncbi:MAG: carboxypeptidase regulatory-like domain-containing protein, partial [Candidatus Electrothrix sp. AUS1_2]|nr:carboxypeptidase regulatory-like domain-containing protein [Candidatus Electrothrix sp. AUS1_2]
DHFCSANSVSVTAPNTTGDIDAVLEYPGSSTISGTVTDESGNPISGVEVLLYGDEDYPGKYFNAATTETNGIYQFTHVGSGNYKIWFNGTDVGYSREWYDEKFSSYFSDLVEVIDPENVTGINAALAASGSISGKITDIDDNSVESNCYISVYGDSYDHFNIYTTNGEYTISGIPAGQYKLNFNSTGYATEWYGDKTDFTADQAALVTVNPGATTSDINVVLEKGGAISGKVTNNNNAGIPDVNVTIWIDDIVASGRHGYRVTTDANGDYTFYPWSPLATGSWVVEFDADENNTGYASEWHNDKTSYETADPVSITAPETTVVNAQLAQQVNGGSISGRVTDGQKPLFSISVSVYDSNYSWIKST